MTRLTLITALALAACQSESGTSSPSRETPGVDREPAEPRPATAAKGYEADVERICNVETLSGADAEETTARSIIAAEWLGRNIETQRARDLLAEVSLLGPKEKARRLREEAARAKLPSCQTALAWETLNGAGE